MHTQEQLLLREIAKEEIVIQLEAVYQALRAEYYTGVVHTCPLEGVSEARWQAMLSHARRIVEE